MGIFAGTSNEGKGDGEFNNPSGITVLAPTGDVAVADRSTHRVQVFDGAGKYMRQFGCVDHDPENRCEVSSGSGAGSPRQAANGKFQRPIGLTSDVNGNLFATDYTNRLQVFSSEGKHLRTRTDLDITAWWPVTIAWSAQCGLAIPTAPRDAEHNILIWKKA
jgi:hypothetical protein